MSDYIPMSDWGKDHWSTLAYVETVMVDCAGFQVGCDPRMRSNHRHWRVMIEQCPKPRRMWRVQPEQSLPMDTEKHGTRLKDGRAITDHDDWMCLQDMTVEGLFTLGVDAIKPGVVLRLSDKGWRIAAELRKHKANGGSFGNFTPSIGTAT